MPLRRPWVLASLSALLLAGLGLFVYDGYTSEQPEGETTQQRLQVAPESRLLRLAAMPPGQKAESAVVLIGDGLGFAGIEAGRLLSRGIGGHLELDRMPVAGWSTTRHFGGLVTDSAAGATALFTGQKTLNGHLSVDQKGQVLATLAEAARKKGKSVGVLTDSYLWDATPSALIVHNKTRRDTAGIARAMAASGYELLIGCEARRFADDDRGGPLEAEFRQQGYAIAGDLESLEKAGPGRLLGLFPAGSITPKKGESLLPRLAAWAINRLAQNPQGYLLLIETEETDTGGHQNDLDQLVRGVVALDGALKETLARAEKDGKTLVVLTADHETGGLALLGGGAGQGLRYTWATEDHNAEPVPLLAYGPGAEHFAGTRDNTEVAVGLRLALDLP